MIAVTQPSFSSFLIAYSFIDCCMNDSVNECSTTLFANTSVPSSFTNSPTSEYSLSWVWSPRDL